MRTPVSSLATKEALRKTASACPYLFFEGGRRAGEHIHQSALADRQAEQIKECLLQPLIGQSLTGFQIDRQRVDASATAGRGAGVFARQCSQQMANWRCRRTNG